jgi:hypothetical protein
MFPASASRAWVDFERAELVLTKEVALESLAGCEDVGESLGTEALTPCGIHYDGVRPGKERG